MKNSVALVVAMFAQLIAMQNGTCKELVWHFNMEQAQKIAKDEGKDLFVLFTGHGWCHACELLDRQVLTTDDFERAIQHGFVLVELNLPSGKEPAEVTQRDLVRGLCKQFFSPAVPTVMLATADGQPYGYVTGYEPDAGPATYIRRLKLLQQSRKDTESKFASASNKTGLERARELDLALECVALGLGSVKERHGSPLLAFYRPTIDEILSLVNKQGPLAEKYTAIEHAQVEQISINDVYSEIQKFSKAKDYEGAVKYIEARLESVTSDEVRWGLERSKQTILERADRNDEAFANCTALLSNVQISSQDREYFTDRQAFNLFRLGRDDEALAHYDRRIQAANDSKEKMRLLYWKGQLLKGHAPELTDQAIETWTAYQQLADRNSEAWFEGTSWLATLLHEDGRHAEALPLIKISLEHQKSAAMLACAGECCIGLEQTALAINYLDEAATEANKLNNSESSTAREIGAVWQAKIDELRKQLENKP